MNYGEIHFKQPGSVWYLLMFGIACIPLGFALAGIVAIREWWTGNAEIKVDSLKPKWLRWLKREERILAAVCYWALAALLALIIVSIARRQIDRFEKLLYSRQKLLLVYPWPHADKEISVADVKSFEFEPYHYRAKQHRRGHRPHWRLVLETSQGKQLVSRPKEPVEWEKELPQLFELVPEFKQIDRTDYSSILR